MESFDANTIPTFGFDSTSMIWAVVAVAAVVLLAVLIPVLAIRGAGKWKRLGKDFRPGVVRLTGLSEEDGGWQGTYKGFPVKVRRSLGTNLMNVGQAVWTGNSRPMYGRGTFYMAMNVMLSSPGASFPRLVFREHLNVFVHTDQVIQDAVTGKNFSLPAEIKDLRGDWKKLRVYGEDRAAAEKILADPELRRLMADWHYADVRLAGDQVELVLDNNNVANKYGYKRLMDPAMIAQALDICARFAQIAA